MLTSLSIPRIHHRFHRRLEEARRFIGNYIYYRKRRHGHRMAWSMARDTL